MVPQSACIIGPANITGSSYIVMRDLLKSLGLVREKNPQVKVVGIYEVKGKPYCLIELFVKNLSRPFEMNEFTQEWPTVPRTKWPKPYLCKLLDNDGTKIIADINPDEPTDPSLWSGNLRICFFLHFPAYDLPLLTPWGSAHLPPKTPRPRRLAMIRYQQPE